MSLTEQMLSFSSSTIGLTSLNTSDEPTQTSGYDFEGLASSAEPLTVKEQAMDMLLYKLGMGIHVYYTPVMVPIGIVGNILSFLVMMQRHNRELSMCSYISGLAIADTVMLCLAGEYWLFTAAWPTRYAPNPLLECRLNSWMVQFVSLTGILIILSMTTDRLIAVWSPLRARVLCTVFRARLVCLVSVLFSMIYSIPHIFATGLIEGTHTCVSCYYTNTVLKIFCGISICLNSLAPFLALLVMNTLIIYKVKHRQIPGEGQLAELTTNALSILPGLHRNYKWMQSKITGSKLADGGTTAQSVSERQTQDAEKRLLAARRSREAQLTVILLVVTFAFLALIVPLYIRIILFMVIDFSKDPTYYSISIFLYHLTNKMYFTNNAANFYLYCLSGPKFRRDLKRLFRRRNQVAPAQVGIELAGPSGVQVQD